MEEASQPSQAVTEKTPKNSSPAKEESPIRSGKQEVPDTVKQEILAKLEPVKEEPEKIPIKSPVKSPNNRDPSQPG
eukprot:3562223-Karenia_brevis.AAC.1